jgi:hypothetical protein
VYEIKKQQLLKYDSIHLPIPLWKNDFPIILVHGFAGSTTDQSMLFRGYFHYCFLDEVKNKNKIFESDVSPFGSVHDRACELF